MRLLPWRAAQPQDASDQAKLDERLARLTKPPVQDAVPASSAATPQPVAAAAPISPARAKLQELTGGVAATQVGAPIEPERTETKPPVQDAVPATAAVTAEPVAAAATPVVTAKPVAAAATPVVIAKPVAAAATPAVIAKPVAAAATPAVTAKPVAAAAPISPTPSSGAQPYRRRSRRFR